MSVILSEGTPESKDPCGLSSARITKRHFFKKTQCPLWLILKGNLRQHRQQHETRNQS
jgi:hypothetical protein